ncbi:SDR family oxidoreductase [Nocardia fusca]|uniref:SDR family oxidoreductase n=1 Tax=Nocardia fusca TaxID=941183 RepID=UPI0037C7F60A
MATELLLPEFCDHLIPVSRVAIVAIRESLAHVGEGGRIINIGNIDVDRMPFLRRSIYVMTKGALSSLTRELAPRGVTINNVKPGPVDIDANPADGPASAILGVMAVDRFGTAAEVGAFVSFLPGPEAVYVTGAGLNIDGGFGG